MSKAFLYGNGGDSGIDASKVTATANDIIVGKKAYLNDSDEPTAGTLPLNTNLIAGTNHIHCDDNPVIGAWSHDGKERVYIRPRNLATARQAYGPDCFFTKETSSLAAPLGITPDKLVQGHTICGVTGTANTDGGISNFPFTVSLSQPAPQATGHVWVQTNRLGTPSGIYVRENITPDLPNNALILISDDMSKAHMNVSGKSNGVPANIFYNSDTIHDWVVGSLAGKYYYNLPYPRVYTKVNNTIYMENAHIWDGSKWLLVSNADRYFIAPGGKNNSYQRLVTANWIGDTLVHKEAGLGTSAYTESISANKTGRFFARMTLNSTLEIYRRVGDTFTMFQTLAAASFSSYFTNRAPRMGANAVFSYDGTYMAVAMGNDSYSGSANYAKIFKFKLNSAGTAFELFGYTDLGVAGSTHLARAIGANDDLSVIVVALSYSNMYYVRCATGTFTGAQTISTVTNTGYYGTVTVSGNGKYASFVGTESALAMYIDYGTNTVYTRNYYYYTVYAGTCITITNGGEILAAEPYPSQNIFRVYHGIIRFTGSSVSVDTRASNIIYSAEAGTTGYTYAKLSAVSYSGDKNNAYFIAVCGRRDSSYGDHFILYKAIFSGDTFSTLLKLGEMDSPYDVTYSRGIMIGGQ